MDKQRWCKTCGKYTLHVRRDLGLGWGCLLTLLTGGLFLPLWLLFAVCSTLRPMRCQAGGRGRLT